MLFGHVKPVVLLWQYVVWKKFTSTVCSSGYQSYHLQAIV